MKNKMGGGVRLRAKPGRVVVIMRSSLAWRTDLSEAFSNRGWSLQKGMEIVLGSWLNIEKQSQARGNKTSALAQQERIAAQISASLHQLEALGGLPKNGKKR